MSVQNYNYNFENKTQKNVSEFITSSVEVISCKAASLSKHPKTNGKFYHTTDDDKFYYDWNGQRIQLDIKGETDIQNLIEQAQAAVNAANTAVSDANTAAAAAQAASDAIAANAAHFTNTDIHVRVEDKNNWNNKQDKLDNATVLSTITSNKVSAWDAVAAGSYDVAGSAATALSNAKDYTDEKFAGISTGVSEGYVDTAISTALDGYAKSSEIPSVSTFVSAGYVDSKVSGLVKSVNGLTGDVNVNTFTDITKKFTTADYISNMSTYQLCKKIQTEISPEPGTAYMAKAILTDYPNSFSGNTGELFIYAPSRGMYIIDMYTTNNFSDKGNTDAALNDCGKFTTIYDVYYNGGEGKIVELWSASLVCPQTSTSISGQYKYVPTEDWHATSKYYVDNAIANISVTGVSAGYVDTTISNALDGYAKTTDVATVSLPTTSISDWGGTTGTSTLPRLTGDDVSKYVTANDVIAFIEEAIKKKSEEGGVTSDVDYLYVNGYEVGGTAIASPVIMNRFEITDDVLLNGIEIQTVDDIAGYEDGFYGAYFAIDVPDGYSIEVHEWDTELVPPGYTEDTYTMVDNPTYASTSYEKYYGSKKYHTYIREYSDLYEDIREGGRYKIIISKNN